MVRLVEGEGGRELLCALGNFPGKDPEFPMSRQSSDVGRIHSVYNGLSKWDPVGFFLLDRK